MPKPDRRIRLLIVDDHPVFLKGLRAILGPEPDMEVVGCAVTGAEAIKLFREAKPDVTLMDIRLGRSFTGIEALQAIRREFPNARVIMLSVRAEEDVIFRALRAGAVSYLLKEAPENEVIRTIREVHLGGAPLPSYVGRKLRDRESRSSLTARELEVLRLHASGLRRKQIAYELGIKSSTVETHFKSILAKLDVHDAAQAVMVAIERGFVEPPSEWQTDDEPTG